MNDRLNDTDTLGNSDMGGMSAGANDGGILDAGSADNDTDFADRITGRKGGASGPGDEENGNGSFDVPDAGGMDAGIGDTGGAGTDRGMGGTFAGGDSTANSSGL